MKRFVRYISIFLLPTMVVAQSVTVQKSAPTNENLTPEAQAAVVRLSNLERAIWTDSMNSPGVKLSLKEVSRSRTTDRTLVKYELYSIGLPKNVTYTLVEIKISGKVVQSMTGVTLDSDGRAICAGRRGTCSGSRPNSPIDLVLFAGNAEPKRLSLVSDDEAHLKGVVSVVPFPNVATDKGCRLESVIGTPKGEVTYIHGSGFEPNEELVMDGESYGEKNYAVQKAEVDGSYFATLLPNVLGKSSGTTVIEVKGKNCDPKLSFYGVLISWNRYVFLDGSPTASPQASAAYIRGGTYSFSNCRAITSLCISLVPSPMVHSFTSR